MSSERQLQHGMVHANSELYPAKSAVACMLMINPTLYFVIELSKRYEATHIFIFHQTSFQRSQV